MRNVLALLWALMSTAVAAEVPQYTTMSPEGLRTGVLLRQADCPDRAGFAWVAAPYPDGVAEGVCIRYYAAGLAATNRTAIVFLHGNRLNYVYDDDGKLVRIGVSDSYGTPSEASLQRAAEMQSNILGHPFIIIGRPGNYGSSGIASEQYRRRETRLVNAALDVIKQRHGVDAFGVAAQSGGGPALAGLLAYRDDIRCAAFSSSLTAIAERERTASRTRVPTLSERTPELYDPIREVGQIRASQDRRIFVVGDTEDRLIPFSAQQAYADALHRQGLQVAVTTSTAIGANRHSLGATGQRAVGWCIDGVADAEIIERMRRGEAAHVIPGGFY